MTKQEMEQDLERIKKQNKKIEKIRQKKINKAILWLKIKKFFKN